MFNDFIDWCRKLLDIFVGWLFIVIVGSVFWWLDLFLDERCEGCCLLNDFFGKELFGMFECKFVFFWLFIELYDCMILFWLFFSDLSVFEIVLVLGLNIVLVDFIIVCIVGL